MSSDRDSRIYRVNAWREYKGRPALIFAEPEPEQIKPGGPEWWTEANTAAWSVQQWGNTTGRPIAQPSQAQGVWAHTMRDACGKAGALCYRPIPMKELAKWRKNDPRPTPITFYDGKVDAKRASLPTAAKPARPTPNGYLGRIAAAMEGN